MINLNVHTVELVCDALRERIAGRNLQLVSDVNPLKVLNYASPALVDFQGTLWIEVDTGDGGATAVGLNGFHHVPYSNNSRWVVSISSQDHVRLWAFNGTEPRGSYDISQITLASLTDPLERAVQQQGSIDHAGTLRSV